DRGALRGTKEEHGVDIRYIEPLVEHIDGEDDLDSAVAEPQERLVALVRWRRAGHRRGRHTSLREGRGHGPGVCDVDAEAQRLHLADVTDLVPDLIEDDAGAGLIAGVQTTERVRVVCPARPGDPTKVCLIIDREVVEGRQ